MNWRTLNLLPLALTIAGCSTPAYEVIRLPGGDLRAPTYVEATGYCRTKGSAARMLGRAPGETGVLFRCD